jgi:hypothetical protein
MEVENRDPDAYALEDQAPLQQTTRTMHLSLFKRLMTRRVVVPVLIVGLIIALVYSQYQLRVVSDPSYQQKKVAEETARIVDTVGRLIVLPVGVTPQVATVQNADTLRTSEPFFLNAHNGDELLVYPDRAILYSPSLNKIVNVEPVTPTAPAVQKSTTAK